MSERVVFRVTLRSLLMTGGVALLLTLLALFAPPLWAQKVQESYRDKFNIAEETGGVAIATSSDGKYVYVAGRNGVIVSGDFGKTGTWVQTVGMK